MITFEISIVIVTYQRGDLLQECLESIYAQRGLPEPFEIIVIDNGGDAVVASPHNPNIHLKIIRSQSNLGVAGGRNLGINRSKGKYLIFLDDDAVWHEDKDILKMVEHFRANPYCGAVAVKSLKPDGTPIVGEYPHPNKAYISQVTRPIEVPYYYGVGHGLRADALKMSGDYPVRYFYAMEEIDLSLRIINNGYSIIYNPDIAVYHRHSAFGRPIVGVSYWQRNMLNKSRVAWRLLPYRYLLSTVFFWSARVLIKTRKITVVLAVWKQLWLERSELVRERQLMKPDRLAYLKKIGARLIY